MSLIDALQEIACNQDAPRGVRRAANELLWRGPALERLLNPPIVLTGQGVETRPYKARHVWPYSHAAEVITGGGLPRKPRHRAGDPYGSASPRREVFRG